MSKDDKKRYLILKDNSVYKGLIILAIPVMISNFIKTIHDIVDMYFVSQIDGFGTSPVGSISVTFPVIFTFISLGIGLSIAGTSLISQLYGAAHLKESKKYAFNLIVMTLVIGLILNFIAYFSAPLVMGIMGAKGYILENSVKYIQVRSFELPILFLFFGYTSIRQAAGDTVTPFVLGVITIFVNIILSPILILENIDFELVIKGVQLLDVNFSGYNLGVSGAAYATLIAHIIILPIIVLNLFVSKTGITLKGVKFKVDKIVIRNLAKTAIPASFGQSLTAIGFIVMTSFIISYGDDTVAAFSVGNRISSLILHPAMAIGGILSAYVGQNIGNFNVSRAKEAFKKAMILGVGVMIVGCLLIINLRYKLAGIFIEADTYAFDLATEYLLFVMISLPLMAVYQTFIGVYNGTGNTKYTFVIGVVRLWLLRIPLIIVFKYFTDLDSSGIWYAMITSNILIVILSVFLYKKIDFKPKLEIGNG